MSQSVVVQNKAKTLVIRLQKGEEIYQNVENVRLIGTSLSFDVIKEYGKNHIVVDLRKIYEINLKEVS